MKPVLLLSLLFFLLHSAAAQVISITEVEPDLMIPEITDAAPAPGKRVRNFLPERKHDEIYHTLYLPHDWEPGKHYPVIFEYPGNRYKTSPGTIEGCELGYGISGGEGVIWVCLPFVDPETGNHAPNWWGDVSETVAYAKATVEHICKNYGGDPEALFLAGFSRGSIACNYIGLHDDQIAALWRGFICHSHYDGVKKWSYPNSDRASAQKRLNRLGDRPQFISQEKSVAATSDYLDGAYPKGNFTFLSLPVREHTASWVLRDIPARKQIREWFQNALPGP